MDFEQNLNEMRASCNRIDKNLDNLQKQLQAINEKIAAMRELNMTRVSNRNMFKRETLGSAIKGK